MSNSQSQEPVPKNPAGRPGRGWGCVSRRGQPCPVPLRGVADPRQQLLDPPADFGGRQLHVSVLGAAQVAGHEAAFGRQGQQLRFPCGTEAGTGQGLRGRGAREWPKNARFQGQGTAASCLPRPHHAAWGPAVPPAPPQALASGSCRRSWVLGARCHTGSWWQSPARCLQNPRSSCCPRDSLCSQEEDEASTTLRSVPRPWLGTVHCLRPGVAPGGAPRAGSEQLCLQHLWVSPRSPLCRDPTGTARSSQKPPRAGGLLQHHGGAEPHVRQTTTRRGGKAAPSTQKPLPKTRGINKNGRMEPNLAHDEGSSLSPSHPQPRRAPCCAGGTFRRPR